MLPLAWALKVSAKHAKISGRRGLATAGSVIFAVGIWGLYGFLGLAVRGLMFLGIIFPRLGTSILRNSQAISKVLAFLFMGSSILITKFPWQKGMLLMSAIGAITGCILYWHGKNFGAADCAQREPPPPSMCQHDINTER